MAAKQAALDPKRLVNPLEYVYASLACKLELLEPNSSEAQYILRYIKLKISPKKKIKFNLKNIKINYFIKTKDIHILIVKNRLLTIRCNKFLK